MNKSGDAEHPVREYYRHALLDSGVRVVPGETLSLYHRVANFVYEKPFLVVLGLGAPALATVYKTQFKTHEPLELKVLHTRVMGQMSLVGIMLGVVGFQQYMSHYGKYLTTPDVERRVTEMIDLRYKSWTEHLKEGTQHELDLEKQAHYVKHHHHH